MIKDKKSLAVAYGHCAYQVGLIAHDKKKKDLVRWCQFHADTLKDSKLVATGTTGQEIIKNCPAFDVTCLASGPLGGDQQMGALLTSQDLGLLIFFIDPLSPHPHDVDIKALLRLATLYDIPCACNEATASLILQALR